ncbi:MAG: glycosyltransferase family 4 protein, partial [Bacteroidales bacterium]|nr:glycosyltransferase family 4 protein [Bacteroidales bacterium]
IITYNYPRGKSFDKIGVITLERNNDLVRLLRNPITPGLFKIKDYTQDFDIVHVHNEHSFSAMVAAFLKSKNNFPLILTNHGQLRFDSFFADLVEKIYAKSIGKIIFRRADRIVALSLSDANYISSFGKKCEKISILPNAIDSTEFASYADKQNTDFLKKYKLDGKKIVLFVGQIIQRKGVKYLMRSISYVINEFPNNNVLFLIVGKGDFSEKAKEIVRSLNIGDSVLFTGEISFDELVQAYMSADV